MASLDKYNCVDALVRAGISHADAIDLRRILMTLHRWHEMECGDSNDYRSYVVVRGKKNGKEFEYDDNGTPFLEIHEHRGDAKAKYQPIADRERGALKRLDAIMARHPGYASYVQTDPRGASLYILSPEQVGDARLVGHHLAHGDSGIYTRGIAVMK